MGWITDWKMPRTTIFGFGLQTTPGAETSLRYCLITGFKGQFERLFEETEGIPLALHYAMAQRQSGLKEEQLANAAHWFDRIRAVNETRRVYSEKILNSTLTRFYLENLCKSQASLRFVRGAFKLPLLSACTMKDRFKTYFKCVFRKFSQ